MTAPRQTSSKTPHKKASMNDVAAAAGVSKTTVSRYLHGEFGYMSEQTRERIANVIEQLEYRPNKMAQSLKAPYSNIIGVTIADIANPFSSKLIKGIQTVCREEGLQLLVCDADNRAELERSSIESLVDAQVDGMIINTVGSNDEYLVDYCSSLDAKPIVMLDRTTRQQVCDSIVTDNQGAVFEMLKHLQQQGFEQIVFVTPPIGEVSTRTVRADAVRDWCELYGMQYQIVVTHVQESERMQSVVQMREQEPIQAPKQMHEQMHEQVHEQPIDTHDMDATDAHDIDASGARDGADNSAGNDVAHAIEQLQTKFGQHKLCIFANNEETIRYILATMPQVSTGEFGLCGFAEEEWARFSGPGISCLDQDPVRMGTVAARQLIMRIREQQAQREGANTSVAANANVYAHTNTNANVATSDGVSASSMAGAEAGTAASVATEPYHVTHIPATMHVFASTERVA